MNNQFILKGSHIGKIYNQGSVQLDILVDVEFQISAGECVAIVGASGSGKSTLLQILAGLDQPTTGHIFYNSIDITQLKEKALNQLRNETLGFVYQMHHLLPEFSSLENVAFPLLIQKKFKPAIIKKKAINLLEKLGLADRLYHKPEALSGGEKQRVAIARALIANPKIIMMDEPTGNLDPNTAKNIEHIILNLASEMNVCVVLVTHDHNLAAQTHATYALEMGRLQLKN